MAWGWRPWLPGWHHGLWGALEAERPDACSFLLWWEHHHYGQGYRNWVWYWCVVLGVLSPGRQSWPPPITQAWIGLQYPQQLKESSPPGWRPPGDRATLGDGDPSVCPSLTRPPRGLDILQGEPREEIPIPK